MENAVLNLCSEGAGRGSQREVLKLPDEADTWMHLFYSVVVATGKLKSCVILRKKQHCINSVFSFIILKLWLLFWILFKTFEILTFVIIHFILLQIWLLLTTIFPAFSPHVEPYLFHKYYLSAFFPCFLFWVETDALRLSLMIISAFIFSTPR